MLGLIMQSGSIVRDPGEDPTTKSYFSLPSTLFLHVSRCKCVQTGIGRDHSEGKGLPQAHQDVGAVWRFHEDP